MLLKNAVNTINLEITSMCNLHCPFCYNLSHRNGTDVPLELIIPAIEYFKQSCTEIILSGGEPMLYKDLKNLLNHLYLMGIPSIRMISNATMVNNDILSLLSQYNVKLQISFNYDRTIQWHNNAPLFRRQIKNIERLINANVKEITLRSMIYNTNKNATNDILHVAMQHNIKQVYFTRVQPIGLALHNHALKLTGLEQYTLYKMLKKKKIKYANRLDINVFEFHAGLCNVLIEPIKKMQISLAFDGSVYPCWSLCGQHFSLGNYFLEDFDVILTSNRLSTVQNSIYCAYEPCKKCAIRKRCIPPCPISAEHRCNDFDLLCGIRKMLDFSKTHVVLNKVIKKTINTTATQTAT